MGRPSKPIALSTGKSSKEDIEVRVERETKLKGNNDKLNPPSYMSSNAKKIFKFLVKETEEAKTFGNVDVFILEQFCNTYAIYKELQIRYVKTKDDEVRGKLETRIRKQTDQLPRLYSELGLTPQSRAKLGAINLQAKEEAEDPLMNILEKRKQRLERVKSYGES